MDLLDAAAPLDVIFRERKVEKVVHAAWVTKHPDYWSCLSNTEWQAASLRLFEALVDAGGNHFTFVGSCAEYNWKEWGVHDEPHSSYPETLYGASKLIVSKTLARRAREQGVKFATCRVFFPFGIHENPSRVTSLVADSVLRGKPFHLRSADVYRDIYSNRTAAEAICAIAKIQADGVFDISSGRPRHLGDFLRDDLAGACGQSELITWDSLGGADFKIASPDVPILVGDSSRLRTLGVVPSYTTDYIREFLDFREFELSRV